MASPAVGPGRHISPPGLNAILIAAPPAACPQTVTVTTTGDSGPGSLRQALADVCSGGTIDFDAGLAGQTIVLTSTELSIANTVTITNPVAPGLQISGDNARRVFTIQAGAVVTLSHLSIINGKASNGGGIYNSGALTIEHSTFSGNSASYGGGIRNQGILTVNYSVFSGNSAAFDGGSINNHGTLAVNYSTFSGNSATWCGAGIYNDGMLTVDHSTFSRNSADLGAGIFNYSMLTVNNSTFNSNSATIEGGGIRNVDTLTVNNSTFSGNSATTYGGGIYNDGTVTVNHSTFSGNSATSRGGGIITYYYGSLHLRNSILANSPGGGDCVSLGQMVTNLNNLIEDGSCSPAYTGDPLLAPLGDYGGPTLTFALLPGSPAMDAGDAAACLPTDQRGIARPQGSGCDIGAFELRGFTLTVVSSANPSQVGQMVTFTATVTSELGVPTGSITFVFDGVPQLPPVALVAGRAVFTTASLTPGNHTVRADYSGDASFSPAGSILPGGQTVSAGPAPTVQFSQATFTASEGDGASTVVTLHRSGDLTHPSQVRVSLSGGTAAAGADYNSTGFPITLTFDTAVASRIVPISLIDDSLVEPTETISLTLTGLSNAVIGPRSQARLLIVDNDTELPKVYLPLLLK